MDIFQVIYYFSLFCGPILAYIIFKKSSGPSRYSKPVWYNFLKAFFAKNTIRTYQDNQKLILDSKNREHFEKPKDSLKDEETDTQVIYAADVNGNYVVLKITLREKNCAEVSILLKLSDGRIYTLPSDPNVLICSTVPGKWKAENLEITVLQPFARLRITYNGLLKCTNQSKANNLEEDIQHVNFNLIWNTASQPNFYPEDANENILAEALAIEKWKDNHWIDLIKVERGYEEFGELKGFIKGSAFDEEHYLALPSWRRRFYGPSQATLLYRDLNLFGICENGLAFNIGVKSYQRNCSHMKYGMVIKPNKETLTIDSNDISLEHLFDGNGVPSAFTVHFTANEQNYRCVIHANPTSDHKLENNFEKNGWKQNIFEAECDVNKQQGKCLITSWRRIKNKQGEDEEEEFILPPPLLIPLNDKNINNEEKKKFVSKFSDEYSKYLKTSGGKGNSLALLYSSINFNQSEAFDVPDGFIVTVDAFKRQLESNVKLREAVKELSSEKFTDNKELSLACEKLQSLFGEEDIDEEIKQDILKQFEEFRSKNSNCDLKWAVRSSGVGEDSEDLSAAGQNSTFLGCSSTEQVLKAVGKCWGSLYSFQSVQYRKQHGLAIYAEMAVVVQKMIPSEVAGVLFTCHPTSGNPAEMVITANYGLGESVVSGQTDPDTIVLSRSFKGEISVKSKSVGSKLTKVVMSQEDKNNVDGTKIEQINQEETKKLCLDEEQMIKLGKVGVYIEKMFGGPRDIEWAFYQGRLYLLQARPITTLNTWTDYELQHEFDSPIFTKNIIYTTANVGEVLPGAMTALSQTVVNQTVNDGVNKETFKKSMPLVSRNLTKYNHHIFMDLINGIYSFCEKELTFGNKVMDLAIIGRVFRDEKIHQQAIDHNGIMSTFQRLDLLRENFQDAYNNNLTYEKTLRLSKNHHIELKDEDTMLEMLKKIEAFNPVLAYIGQMHCRTSKISIFYQFIAMHVMAGNITELSSDHFHDISYLLSSCQGVVSAEIPVILDEIAQEIYEKGFSERFVNLPAKECKNFLKNKVPRAFEVYEKFLENYGHRSIREFELATETWGMDEEKLIKMIQINAKSKTFTKKTKSLTPEETIAKLTTVKSKIQKAILKWLVGKCRDSVKRREDTKSELILNIHKLRMAFIKLAEKMVKEGFISDKKLIFHFTNFELKEFLLNRNPGILFKVTKRQKLYEKWDKLKYPEMNFGVPIAENEKTQENHNREFFAGKTGDTIKLVGTPVYTGNIVGRCCVIPDLSQIDLLKSGDILITHSTDIGWSPYFPMLAGIVTEIGGLISHGAVVAREYGLPSIVGVTEATHVFKTGDTILLNGKMGTIELIERVNE